MEKVKIQSQANNYGHVNHYQLPPSMLTRNVLLLSVYAVVLQYLQQAER